MRRGRRKRRGGLICFAVVIIGLGMLSLCTAAVHSAPTDSSMSFTTLVSFAKDEFGFSLSVVSDSSLWYTTNKGVFHLNGKRSEKIMDASAFSSSLIEVLLVDALADDDVWVMGHDAKTWKKTMYHFDGRRWNRITFPQASSDPNDDLVVHKLKMFKDHSSTFGCVVGQDGLTYFYNGQRWAIIPKFTDQTLRALEIIAPDNIWVGGKNGTIFHFDGKVWQASTIEDSSNNYIFDLNFSGKNNGWAAGVKGMQYFNGEHWQLQYSSAASPLSVIKMISDHDGIFVTRDGYVFRYTGEQWLKVKELNVPVGENCLDASCGEPTCSFFLVTRTGLLKSHWGKIPAFSDFSAASNIHLYGGFATFGDFDGNGTEDLYTSSNGSYPDRLYSNRGDGFFTEVTDRLHPLDEPAGVLSAVADIDNNGLLDLFFSNRSQQGVWYRNLGGWKFKREATPISAAHASERDIARFADMDNDGDLDLVYLYAEDPQRAPSIKIFFNDGIGNFPDSSSFGKALTTGAFAFLFFLADLNNDGLIDLFKYNVGDRCELYLNNGDRTFTEAASASGIDGTYFENMPTISYACPVDINNDGATDVFIVWRKGKATFFLNDGSGKFSPGESVTFDSRGENPDVRFLDIDCDGDEDLMLLGTFYRNDGGKFSVYNDVDFSRFGSAEICDVDNDGDEDIVLQSLEERGRIYVYKNEYNPSQFIRLSLHGIQSNAFGIGAKITLWKHSGSDTGILVKGVQVVSTIPVQFSCPDSFRFDVHVTFPGGRTVVKENISGGNLIVSEFAFPFNLWWDFYYSFFRSIKYASVWVEIGKLLALVVLFVALRSLPVLRNVQAFLRHPLLMLTLLVFYVLIVHATIREGIFLSGILSVSGIVLLTAGSTFIAKILAARREANYISHYKLLEQLGEGGMGRVYKALDRNTKQVVALKILNPSLLKDAENRRRLMNEGQLLSSFSHPHIVKVFEVSEAEDLGFIAMEFLAGGTLRESLEKSFPIDRVVLSKTIFQICGGLSEIHERGIIHRDVKTGNIMLDEKGDIRIMDFGLSKSPLITMMTTLGTVIGTLGYVAPEQVTGMNVDKRVDIFSFGVVLYELLTNQLPFKGENEIAVIHSIFNTIPPMPSSFQPNIPAGMDSIVAKCLAKNPEDRFSSVEEVRIALEKEFC